MRREIIIKAKKVKIHRASHAIESTGGHTGEKWDETQELLDDPVFMKSHERRRGTGKMESQRSLRKSEELNCSVEQSRNMS